MNPRRNNHGGKKRTEDVQGITVELSADKQQKQPQHEAMGCCLRHFGCFWRQINVTVENNAAIRRREPESPNTSTFEDVKMHQTRDIKTIYNRIETHSAPAPEGRAQSPKLYIQVTEKRYDTDIYNIKAKCICIKKKKKKTFFGDDSYSIKSMQTSSGLTVCPFVFDSMTESQQW